MRSVTLKPGIPGGPGGPSGQIAGHWKKTNDAFIVIEFFFSRKFEILTKFSCDYKLSDKI